MRIIIALLFTLGLSAANAADDRDAPEIRSLMAPEDFTASGLDKLTDAERAHLSEWLERYREGAIKGPPVPGKERKAAAAAVVASEATEETEQAAPQVAAGETTETTPETTDEYPGGYRTQKEKKKKKDKKVKYQLIAKVVPTFIGWNGKTVFRLDNGQVWQQRMAGRMRYDGSDSTVIITQNFMGKFIMEHEASGRSIGVKRID